MWEYPVRRSLPRHTVLQPALADRPSLVLSALNKSVGILLHFWQGRGWYGRQRNHARQHAGYGQECSQKNDRKPRHSFSSFHKPPPTSR